MLRVPRFAQEFLGLSPTHSLPRAASAVSGVFLQYVNTGELPASEPRSQVLLTGTAPVPQMLALNSVLLQDWGLQGQELQDLCPYLTAQKQIPQAYASVYGGHQFGHWAGQLGDGRAVVIGEFLPHYSASESQTTHQPLELQLKGAGRTPYSRQGDGKAVLRSSVREYLASEAMAALGVPTTRALSLVSTGEWVMRDKFYDGRAALEPGALVCRVAPSFLRFGNFEWLASQGQTAELEKLVHFVCREFYPKEVPAGLNTGEQVIALFQEVTKRTAHLVAQWLSVGFVHGVLNTDNNSILGLTLDYGPYGFMEEFDWEYTPNTSDLPGRRYCYGRQPAICHWNLSRLAGALGVLLDSENKSRLNAVLSEFENHFESKWNKIRRLKLGLPSGAEESVCLTVANDFFALMEQSRFSLAYVFRELSHAMRSGAPETFLDKIEFHSTRCCYDDKRRVDLKIAWKTWLEGYIKFFSTQSDQKQAGLKMCEVNPRIVLGNHRLGLVAEELEKGNKNLLEEAFELVCRPFDDWPDKLDWYLPAEPEVRTREKQMNSCSS